jgi:hypothetical protein
MGRAKAALLTTLVQTGRSEYEIDHFDISAATILPVAGNLIAHRLTYATNEIKPSRVGALAEQRPSGALKSNPGTRCFPRTIRKTSLNRRYPAENQSSRSRSATSILLIMLISLN